MTLTQESTGRLALVIHTAGADREVATCGEHITDTLRRGKVVQVLDDNFAGECHVCQRESAAEAARKQALTMRLARAGVARFGQSGETGGYDASWGVWFAFPRRLSDAVVLRRLEDAGVHSLYARHCGHSWDCCGCAFSDGPWIRRSKGWTLVRQSWARNV